MTGLLSLLLFPGPAHAQAPPLDEGVYVMVVEVGSESQVPLAGSAEITTRSLLRVDLDRTADGGWQQRQQLCAIDIQSDTRASTVLPQAFVDAMPIKRYPVRIAPREDGSWSYRADPGPNHIGYDPRLTGGALPERRNDIGVVDFEGDGQPGATMLIQVPILGNVRMYIAQLGWPQFEGEVRDGRIEGRVWSRASDSRTLGASVGLFAANATITPVPERSRFQVLPVAASETCDGLASRWGRTFSPPLPPRRHSARAPGATAHD